MQKPSATLYLAAASALLGAIGMGAVLGWTSPAFDTMSKNGSVPRLTDNADDKAAKSWIGSSMTLGALVGALISGPMAQFFGRKKALIAYGIPFTIGWLLMAFARSVTIIIIGRIIAGFSAGLLSGTAPTYVVEISIISIRGFLGACFQLCVTIGILMVYVVGAFIDWNYLAGIAAVPTLLMAILMFFMPETPSWLISHNKRSEAEQSLKSLRGAGSDTDQEMSQLQEQTKASEQGQSFSLALYAQKFHLCPMLLGLGLMFFQQFSGINAVMFYATSIFSESGSSLEPKIASIIVGVAQVFATVAGSLLVDRLGRKILLSASGALHVLSTAALGLYYYCIGNDATNSDFGWVPLASLVVFIIGFSIGWGPVPWLMIAEITPDMSRSATSAFATAFNWTCAFFVSKYFEALKDAITKHGTFFLFSACSLLSIVFVVLALPETKGKSSEEIQEHFGGPKNTSGRNDGLLKNGNNPSSAGVEMDKLNA